MKRFTHYETDNKIAFVDFDDCDSQYYTMSKRGYKGAAIDKLADYEDAEENELLIKLPCKIGATLFVITKSYPENEKQSRRTDLKNYKIIEYEMSLSLYEENKEDFGKKVFCNLEDAEKELDNLNNYI